MGRNENIILWSDEDRAGVAEVPGWPGSTAHGGTCREALSAVERVIGDRKRRPRGGAKTDKSRHGPDT